MPRSSYKTDSYRAWQREYKRKRNKGLRQVGLNSRGKQLRKRVLVMGKYDELDMVALKDPEIRKGRKIDGIRML